MSAVNEAREGLAQLLTCSQCGGTYAEPACGPTHAILAAEPERHRLIAPLVEALVESNVLRYRQRVASALAQVAHPGGLDDHDFAIWTNGVQAAKDAIRDAR